MPRQSYSAGEAAKLLGVSLDTLRRWDRQGRIKTRRDRANRRLVPASEIDRLRRRAQPADLSARNRLAGVVREVTREAADQLELKPGASATAVVKATSVLIER